MPRQNHGPYLTDQPNDFGLWEIRWTEDGRSKRKSTGTANRRIAQRVLASFLESLDPDAVGPAGALTAEKAIDAYLLDKTDVCDLKVQRMTFGLLKAHFGDLALGEIDDEDARAYITARAAGKVSFKDENGEIRGGHKGRGGTVRRELVMLRTAIAHCVKKRKFKDGAGRPLLTAAHIPHYDLPAAPPPKDRWLSRAEASAFLAACQPEGVDRLTREYRYVAMLLYTASRTTPVEKLTWDRIDLDNGLINFRAPGERVTRKRRGFVPIGSELRPILERAKREAATPYYLDKPIQPESRWRAAAKRAGLVGADGGLTVSPHVLRHSFATWAAQDGVPLYTIAGILHDCIATVEKSYAHHSPDHLRKAVDRAILEKAA